MSEIKEKATSKTLDERLDALEKALTAITASNMVTVPEIHKGRTEMIANVLKDYDAAEMEKFQKALEAHDKARDAQREVIMAERDIQDERILRASLGVKKDRPIMVSELPSMLRKAYLEISESGKKTPAPAVEKAGAEAKKPDQFEEMMKQKGLVEAA